MSDSNLRLELSNRYNDLMFMKSSLMRMSLAKHIRQVISSGEDLVIEHDSREVAVLSLTPPSSGTSPKRMMVVDAQNGWAELLGIVWIRGARYYFKLKPKADCPESPRVYLYRTEVRNRFNKEWNEHRAMERQEQSSDDTVADVLEMQSSLAEMLEKVQSDMAKMNDVVQSVSQNVRCVFAAVNRGGYLLNTPENGVDVGRTLGSVRDDAED